MSPKGSVVASGFQGLSLCHSSPNELSVYYLPRLHTCSWRYMFISFNVLLIPREFYIIYPNNTTCFSIHLYSHSTLESCPPQRKQKVEIRKKKSVRKLLCDMVCPTVYPLSKSLLNAHCNESLVWFTASGFCYPINTRTSFSLVLAGEGQGRFSLSHDTRAAFPFVTSGKGQKHLFLLYDSAS